MAKTRCEVGRWGRENMDGDGDGEGERRAGRGGAEQGGVDLLHAAS